MEFKCRRVAIMIYILCFIQENSLSFASLDAYNLNSFMVKSDTSLNHFTVSEDGSSIYIGGVGRLYRLSRDFSELTSVSTQDNSGNNTNKILSIVPQPVDKLISCGSGLNGTCQLWNLTDLRDTKDETLSSLKVTEDQNPAISLVVTHPAGVDVNLALYVAQNIRGASPISANCLSRSDRMCQMGDNRRTSQFAIPVLENFLIRYVASFSYNDYTYFIASQLQDATGNRQPNYIVPKLSRVCQTDSSSAMDGFTEITLECRGVNDTLYSIVQSSQVVDGQLFAVFVKNNEDEYFDLASQSAVCIYEMKNLIEKFEEATIDCSCEPEGVSIYSSNNYLNDAKCRLTEEDIPCSTELPLPCITTQLARYPERHPGLGPIRGDVVFEHSGETFTSILVTKTMVQTASQNVAFIGSQEGHLLKVRFDVANASSGVVYEQLELQSSVLSDTWISNDTESIMVLTERKLIELSVTNCSQYQTCDECIKPGSIGGDPYCGWCTLEKRCTRFDDCDGSDDSERWLPFNEDECVTVSASPEHLPVDVTTDRNVNHFLMSSQIYIDDKWDFIIFLTQVNLNVTHLPTNENYSCHFGNFISKAFVIGRNQLVCQSPDVATLPNIPVGDDAVEVELSLSSSEYNITFVSIPYYFFDCNRITGCVDCSTQWDCNWCVDDFTCSFKTDPLCGDFIMDSEDCPMLRSGDIFIPNGLNREIIFTVQTPTASTNISNKEYKCVIGYEQTEIVLEATLSNKSGENFTVTCKMTQYSYMAEEQMINASFNLRWTEKAVDIDGTINVILYKCSVDRPDCSRCLSNITTPPVLMCIWCSSQSLCAVRENCNQGIQKVCTARPQITLIEPTSGPIEGGTMVQIFGTDLGQRFSDIGRVTLADVLCDHGRYEDQYMVGESVTCMAGQSEVKMGPVSVNLRDDRTSQGDVMFSYNVSTLYILSLGFFCLFFKIPDLNPKLTSYFPEIGPASGGSLITINGTDLDTGRDIEAFVGSEPCSITTIQQDYIECINVNSTVNSSHTVMLRFDNRSRATLDGTEFFYIHDPEVSDVDPKRSILSGGNMLTVIGERLNSIRRPELVFTVDSMKFTKICEIIDAGMMICPSPSLNFTRTRRKRADEAGGLVDVGFIMDGVTELLTWSIDNKETFQYVQDPEYDQFDGGVRDYDANPSLLSLTGRNLNEGSQEIDVKVYIGTELCGNITLTAESLVCTPPENSPPAGDFNREQTEGNLPFVTVLHASLMFELGHLRYTSQFQYTLLIVLSVAVFVLLVLLCTVGLWLLYVRKQISDEIVDLEYQMHEIQDSVSENLKSLFATLQTTMHDFDTALEQRQMIPIHSKRQYILNMLFLGLQVKPPSQPTEEIFENEKIRSAMEEFSSKLLSKKNFLETLIRTIDSHSNVGPRDRVNIASLLSVCLLLDRKQELLTSVLSNLMREKIEDSDGKRNKCRILFSRNETVLDKLISNWVTLFLYKYFKANAATPLYQLYHVIRYVCQKGPIDAVTGKSQFSINDQRMLETQIYFTEFNVDLIANSVTGEKISLPVLDVNTITQIKEKIVSVLYKDVPFSEQPLPSSYDLMWRTGNEGQLIIRDEDELSGNTENGWRKINTLADFNVTPEHACFELVGKQEHPNIETAGQGATAEVDAEGNWRPDGGVNGVQARRNTFRMSIDLPWLAPGTRVWHLVKEEDENEDQDDKKSKRKEIKEVVLPFLPATRNYIQKYVDNLLDAMFTEQDSDIPKAIQYLFQFFDEEAGKLDDPDFAKAWKDNVLALRYWTTIIANPQYALDVGTENYIQACLRILVQVVKDTCAGRSKPTKSQDFSPSRLLYSNFLPGYINKLQNHYLHVQSLGRISSEDLALECHLLQEDFADTFDLTSTQYELFKLLQTYQEPLMEGLEENDVCQELNMAGTLKSLLDYIADITGYD
ncbi:plexin-A4-like [Apostichopus japonicus]|uniref:plexin-A4-like n=1 Tax=Stichopus japonicus TaxID=307972 RepID=UPI003AB3EB5F